MRFPKQFRPFVLVVACATFALGQAVQLGPAPGTSAPTIKAKPLPGGTPITRDTKYNLIRLLNAEWIFVRKPFPQGQEGLIMNANGELNPDGQKLVQAVASHGPAARPGERAQITNVEFRDKSLMIEINGGPRKKAKWYQRLQIGSSEQSMTNVANGPDQNAKGSFIEIKFKDKVPEMTLAEVKDILAPVFDFSVKSAAQAYTETLPQNVRDAIKDKRVLVGMNKEMVQYSKGRPPQRVREKDEQGREYEEWIFGVPPQDVEFIRFNGDEVVQVKTMKVDGERIVKTDKEVFLDAIGQAQVASAPAQPDTAPADTAPKAKTPSLRRPGEAPADPKDGSATPAPLPKKTPDKNPDGSGN
jgi:hypothetical protein